MVACQLVVDLRPNEISQSISSKDSDTANVAWKREQPRQNQSTRTGSNKGTRKLEVKPRDLLLSIFDTNVRSK
jgi:hypothetical protein